MNPKQIYTNKQELRHMMFIACFDAFFAALSLLLGGAALMKGDYLMSLIPIGLMAFLFWRNR